jgi:hypothetical protein
VVDLRVDCASEDLMAHSGKEQVPDRTEEVDFWLRKEIKRVLGRLHSHRFAYESHKDCTVRSSLMGTPGALEWVEKYLIDRKKLNAEKESSLVFDEMEMKGFGVVDCTEMNGEIE